MVNRTFRCFSSKHYNSGLVISGHVLLHAVMCGLRVWILKHISETCSFSSSRSAIERWARCWVAEAQRHVWQLQWALALGAQTEMPKRYQQLGRRRKKKNLSLPCCHSWKGLLNQPNGPEHRVKALRGITWPLPLPSGTWTRWDRVMERRFGSHSATAGALQ